MRLLSVLLLALLTHAASAQSVVHGRVSDAETGEGLAAATVQVVGTTRGTVTNRDGDYELQVPPGADSLRVRYIGYQTATRPLTGDRVDLALVPNVAELDETVVTASVTADEIMRRVAARKAEWRAGLRTWRAEAYSRRTIRARGDVVALVEGQTTAFWDRDRGLREVVTGSRQTGNMGALPLDSFTAADQILNLYDDEIEFGGYDLMGPTHPRATRFYVFAIEGTRQLGDQRVYDLSFRPRNPLQPGLVGTLSVLAGPDALLSVSAAPSGSVQFPLVTQFALTLEQQFSPFGLDVGGQEVWLPADFRMDARARAGNALLSFPDLGFSVNSRLTDYVVNVAVPDSLFEAKTAVVDSAALARGLTPGGVVPLSNEEERALAEIDSTQSLAKALQPTGLLARFVDMSTEADEDEGTTGRAGASGARGDATRRRLQLSTTPVLAYNRAEGARLGAGVEAQARWATAQVDLAYLTAAERWSAHAGLSARVARGTSVAAGARRETVSIGGSDYVGTVLNSVPALVDGDDYFDYVRREGVWAWAQWRRSGTLAPRVRLGASLDDYDSALVETRYTLSERPLPPDNAVADARDLATTTLELELGDLDATLASSVTGHRGAAARLELGRLLDPQSRLGGLDLDAESYSRVEGEVQWFMPTMLRRRLLAPTLHVRLAAGTASAALPVQRAFGIDGRHVALAPFGALRARPGRLTLARRYALVAWEHDFRSVPFEILGWRGAAPRGLSLMLHGAHAWADGAAGAPRTEASVVHHEIGASLGLGYSLPVRLDVTYRLTDDPGVMVGVGVARLF